MLSKPIAGVTSLFATSQTATLQVIQIDNTSLPQTMQVRKRTAPGSQSMSLRSCVPGQWAMWNGTSYEKSRLDRASE